MGAHRWSRAVTLVAVGAGAAHACSMSGTSNEIHDYFTDVLVFGLGSVVAAAGFALFGLVLALKRRRWFAAMVLPTLVLTSAGLRFPSIGMDCGTSTILGGAWQVVMVAIVALGVSDSVPRGRWSLASVVTVFGVAIATALIEAGMMADASSFPEQLRFAADTHHALVAPLAAVTWGFLNGAVLGVPPSLATFRSHAWASAVRRRLFAVSAAGELLLWLFVGGSTLLWSLTSLRFGVSPLRVWEVWTTR